MITILHCGALLIIFAMGDGAFNSALDAQSGGGGTSGMRWIGTLER